MYKADVSLTANRVGNLINGVIKFPLSVICRCGILLQIKEFISYLLATIISKWRAEFKIDRQHCSVALFLRANYDLTPKDWTDY